MAFVAASWKVTPLERGGSAMYAQVNMFNSVQSVSVVKYPAKKFMTEILHRPGESAGTPSAIGKEIGAAVVMNGGYFHVKETQMRCYSPEKTSDATVKVNIWNWSEGWSNPEWYENGVKVADMKFTPGIDPAYLEIFNSIDNKTTRKYCTPADNSNIFTVTPTSGVREGEVRVADLFGNTYIEKVSW